MATLAEQASLQRAIEKALAKEAAAMGQTPASKKTNLWVATTARRKLFQSHCEVAFKEAVQNLKKKYPRMDIVILEIEGV